MGKFTPGPWRWWPCHDGSFKPSGDYVQIASGKTHVAKVQIISVTEKDLELMVAAPTLLNALEFLLEQCEGFNVSGVYFKEFRESRDALDTAYDAIAKATGGAK